jgi:hypothetical protein
MTRTAQKTAKESSKKGKKSAAVVATNKAPGNKKSVSRGKVEKGKKEKRSGQTKRNKGIEEAVAPRGKKNRKAKDKDIDYENAEEEEEEEEERSENEKTRGSKGAKAKSSAAKKTDTSAEEKRKKGSGANKKLSALNCKLKHERYSRGTTAVLEKPVCKGISDPVRILKNGLDREANLSRAGISRAQRALMNAASHVADKECKKISRHLYAVLFSRFAADAVMRWQQKQQQQQQQPAKGGPKNGNAGGTPPVARIMGRHVETALNDVGVRCLFGSPT